MSAHRRPAKPIHQTHGAIAEVCALVGERAAMIFNRVAFYIEGNRVNGEHVHDGKTYARVPASSLVNAFPWLSEDSISRALIKLCEAGLLAAPTDENGKSINLSRQGWRRGKWYALGHNSPIRDTAECIPQKCGMEPAEVRDGTRRSAGTIGDQSSYQSGVTLARETDDQEPPPDKPWRGLSKPEIDDVRSEHQDAWAYFRSALNDSAGGAASRPQVDGRALIDACKRTDHTPMQVLGSLLAFYRSPAIAKQQDRYRPGFRKALDEGRYEAFLESPAEPNRAPPQYESAMDINRRLEREAEQARKSA